MKKIIHNEAQRKYYNRNKNDILIKKNIMNLQKDIIIKIKKTF